jgi:hypothetical protein
LFTPVFCTYTLSATTAAANYQERNDDDPNALIIENIA